MGNNTRQGHSYYGMVIGNHICALSNRDTSDDTEWPLKVISVIYLLLLLCVRS